MTDDVAARLSRLEQRLAALEGDVAARAAGLRDEIASLRSLLATEAEPEATPAWDPEVWISELDPEAEPPRPPRRQLPAIELAHLLGPRALAWVGGLVTLLGVVFFFVLAVNRGWIDDVTRVGLGAAASLTVFGTGFWMRRRYGEGEAALAAVGAGIAGGYATLLAAAALYDLLPAAAALVVAAAIAAAATATALRWSSELVAGIGLVGAICVPTLVAFQGGLTSLGTGFVALVYAGAAVVAVRERWSLLLVAAVVTSAPQIAAIVVDAEGRRHEAVALAVVFTLLYLGTGLAEGARSSSRPAPLGASLITGSAIVAGYSCGLLFHGRDQGVALTVVAVAFLLLCVALYRFDPETSALVGAVGLAVAGVAVAQLVSGSGLAVAWAAQAAVLAWLARRIDDERYHLASLVYLLLAIVHTLAIDAPIDDLFGDVARPAHGIPAVVAVAVAALVLAWQAAPWEKKPRAFGGVWAPLSQALADLREAQPLVRLTALALAALALVYAASLGLVAAIDSFGWAHVAVAALWSAVAVAAVAAGALSGRHALSTAGLVWVAACAGLAAWDARTLDDVPAGWAWLVLGAGAVAATAIHQTFVTERRLAAEDAVGAVLGWLGTAVGLAVLVDYGWLVALGTGFAAAAAALRTRERDYATVLLAAALVDVAVGLVDVLDGSWLVLAYSSLAAALAVVGRLLPERRLQVGATALLVLAVGHALTRDAPPYDLFVVHAHPGNGAQAAVLAAAGVAVLAWSAAGRARRIAGWIAAGLPVYAASLAILELSISFGDRSLHSMFQRGHSGVSALWGLVGLGLVSVGVARGDTALRLGGFALFGVGLAKLFLYDLTFLSSITRAFSFLATGAVLLVAGFLYQRLSGGEAETPAREAT
jgi:uncharacterized membrane protein